MLLERGFISLVVALTRVLVPCLSCLTEERIPVDGG